MRGGFRHRLLQSNHPYQWSYTRLRNHGFVVGLGEYAISEKHDETPSLIDVVGKEQYLGGGESCHIAHKEALIVFQREFGERAFPDNNRF